MAIGKDGKESMNQVKEVAQFIATGKLVWGILGPEKR
jgi:hypothetical protein